MERNIIDHMFNRKVKVTLLGNKNVMMSFVKKIAGFLADDFVPSSSTPSFTFGMPHIMDSVCNQINLELDCSLGLPSWDRPKNVYRGSIIVFILFDLGDIDSYMNVEFKMKEAIRNADDNCIAVVVGIKSDLASDERAVGYKEAKAFTLSIGAKYYFETSIRNPYLKCNFEQTLFDCIDYYDYYKIYPKSAPLIINYLREHEKQPLSKYTNLQMSVFRLVFNNRMLSMMIFEKVEQIHRVGSLYFGKFDDNLFMCDYHYYNVLSYKLSRNIPFYVPIGHQSFFRLLRTCTDSKLIKHIVEHNLIESDYTVRIADELVIFGDIEILELMFKQKEYRCSMNGLSYAILSGRLELVELIIDSHTTKKPKYNHAGQFRDLDDTSRKDLIEFAKIHRQTKIKNYLKTYKITALFNLIKIKITS